MDSKVEIKGNVDVAIGQNHAPITVNYGGAGSGGDDNERATKYVLFRDMTLEQLHQCRHDARSCLANAKHKIYFSLPSLFFAIHAVVILAVILNFVDFITLGTSTGPYMFVFVATFMASFHFSIKKKEEYSPLIARYQGEINGINNELLHRKIVRS